MVQIENRPAVEVINRFNFENAFIYLDPPYVLETRTAKQYKHEMTDFQHEELLKAILQSNAKIIISGYENDLYNDMLNSWNKKTFDANAEYGLKRKEIIWANYEIEPKQITLFG